MLSTVNDLSFSKRDCPSKFVWLKVVSIDRSQVLRFSVDFDHALSCERPFKFPRHLTQSLGIDGIIATLKIIFAI
jgi:hypothetical protein